MLGLQRRARGRLARLLLSAAGESSQARCFSSGRPTIDKLLVANRGEIACRVLTTAKRLGIPTVAVYSEGDRGSRHVEMADEAFCIGPPPARESYLRQDRILEVAARTGTTAVHPGYGFLSENSSFAALCRSEGIAFVGPPAEAIEAMGDKSAAKAAMWSAGVPVVPGYHGEDQSEERLQAEADRCGYPLLVKAVMGGGGKGMKLALDRSQFLDALHSARREAASSFGDERVLVERFITRPRHIEVQVLADAQGNAVYLFERDCSVQRRHQKVIEEAPAPGISQEFRSSIGTSAVAAAKAVGYVSAGTVEFIVDVDSGDYFFMEMNTRLQVEHPVTEAITGLDLVEWQLRVAAGEALPLVQEQLKIQGHSFEARLYAENPENNFLPAGGRVLRWRVPPGAASFANPGPGSSGVRIDSGVREGDLVGVNYDPMIAKVITHGPDRASALRALHDALGAVQVAGLPTNLEFMRRITRNAEFQQGAVDTGFIKKHEPELLASTPATPALLALAAVTYTHVAARHEAQAPGYAPPPAPWGSSALLGAAGTAGPTGAASSSKSSLLGSGGPFRINHSATLPVAFSHVQSGGRHEVALSYCRDGTLEASGAGLGPAGICVSAVAVGAGQVKAEVDGQRVQGSWCIHSHGDEEVLDLWVGGQQHQFRRPLVRKWLRTGAAAAQAGTVVTPMPGKIVKVFVAEGQSVEEGERLVVVEAMKMEHTVRAPCSGVVAQLSSFPGAQVEDGAVLAVVAPAQQQGEEQGAAAAAAVAGAA